MHTSNIELELAVCKGLIREVYYYVILHEQSKLNFVFNDILIVTKSNKELSCLFIKKMKLNIIFTTYIHSVIYTN